jgi:hypothetical protein
VRRVLHDARRVALEVHEDAAAKVADVGCPLAQVHVLHHVEDLGVLVDGPAQGAGGPVALLDERDGAGDERVAAEHQQQRVEQRPVLRRQVL